MSKLKSELTWSFSRSRMFSDCRRAYFYHYYASWGGWERGADEFTRKAYILKNVRNIDAWVGDIVHQIIKWILENKIGGKSIAFEEAAAKSKKMLMQTWEQSRAKLWIKSVKYNLNLFEHYYNREPTREELTPKLQKVINSIRNIYESKLLKSFSGLSKDNFLTIDELDSFDFEGIKLFAIPDFAVFKDGYLIYDWKTGKPSDKDVLQLSCYVLYAVYKWKAHPAQVKVIPAYLTQDLTPTPVEAVGVDEVKGYIRDSIEEMKSILSNVEENRADIEKCPKTESVWRCKNCKFQEICP
jgi:hypothetical protein